MSNGRIPVTVAIPCWGCRDFIREAIHSALAQTYSPLEVLVVEDAGDDGTFEEASRIRDPRLRVIRNERNLGQYGNKNRAVELARTPLIKLLDGDDLLERNAVERLVAAWEQAGPGVGVVFGQFIGIDAHGRHIGTPRRWGYSGRANGRRVLNHVTRQRLPGSMFGNVSAHLFEKAALDRIGGFPNDNAGPGDLETFLKLLATTDVVFVEDVVARYRMHAMSMTGRTFGLRECEDFVRMVEKLEAWFGQQSGLPEHLYDPEFYRQWRIWASGHNIFATFQHWVRRRPSKFWDIRNMYAARGLRREFDRFVALGFGPYVVRSMRSKMRNLVRAPQFEPLFDPRTAQAIRASEPSARRHP